MKCMKAQVIKLGKFLNHTFSRLLRKGRPHPKPEKKESIFSFYLIRLLSALLCGLFHRAGIFLFMMLTSLWVYILFVFYSPIGNSMFLVIRYTITHVGICFLVSEATYHAAPESLTEARKELKKEMKKAAEEIRHLKAERRLKRADTKTSA